MNSLIGDLSAIDLRRAANLKERIDALQQELLEVLEGSQSTGKMRRSVKARWPNRIGRPAIVLRARGRRKMSRAARARLAAVARERWRKRKAAGKKSL
jgi:hypothetical protein